jgi:hypothetical protein
VRSTAGGKCFVLNATLVARYNVVVQQQPVGEAIAKKAP